MVDIPQGHFRWAINPTEKRVITSIKLHAGAGIVANSVPELEYLEVKNKLGVLLATLKEMVSF